MWKAQVLSWWVIDSQGANIPHLATANLLQSGDSLMDVTGEVAPVTKPGVVVVEVWCADSSTIDRIEANPDYGPDVILSTWEETEGVVNG